MSTAGKKPPMTREEWESAMAEIHAKLDSIPVEMPDEELALYKQSALLAVNAAISLGLLHLLDRSSGGSVRFTFAFAAGACTAGFAILILSIQSRPRGR